MTNLIVSEATTVTLPGSTSAINLPPGHYVFDGTPGTLILPSNQFIPRETLPDLQLSAAALHLGVSLFLVAALAMRANR